jgi:hypothetical protein
VRTRGTRLFILKPCGDNRCKCCLQLQHTHTCSIARRQELSIRSFAMSVAKHLMWFTSLTNLVEIRIPKKFSLCIFILISFQALSRVFWKFKIWTPPPGAFRWIFWHGRTVSDQEHVIILHALDLTQSVHAKISTGMHRGGGFKFWISRIPLIGLETIFGWRYREKIFSKS